MLLPKYGFGAFVLVLPNIQSAIIPAQGQQFLVRAALDDFAVFDHQNAVGILDGGQAVGNDDGRAPLDDPVDGGLDARLGERIDGGGGLVQNEQAWIAQNSPGEGNQLLLARGQQIAALAYVAIQPLLETGDDLGGADQFQRSVDLLVGGIGIAVQKILPNGAREEVRGLQYVPHVGVQPVLRAGANVLAVHQNLPLVHIVEAADEVDQGGFTRARFAHDGHVGAKGNVEVEVLQHGLGAVGIGERDVPQLDVPLHGLEAVVRGVELVAVRGDDLGRVHHIGLGGEHLVHALDVDLTGDEVADRVDDPAHGLNHALGIGHE